MKILGVLFLFFGLVLLGLAAFYYMRQNTHEMSPLPEETGVKVIFVSPTP